jgi:amino acid adenylation domain-containing protein
MIGRVANMLVAATFDDLLDRSNLTGRQLLIYAGQRLHPGLVLYNSVYAIGWPGLDAKRFEAAWQACVDSCDALRTVVEEVDGIPQQRVLAPFPAEVECVDLRRDATPARKWIEGRLQRPIVLTERIFDTALIRSGEDDYVWFLHIHHIIVDGAAVQILIRRVTELYWGALDQASRFPQFADHAAAVCTLRQSEKYHAARTHWLNVLQKVPETPYFYGVDASRNTAQERVVLTLDPAVGAAILTLAQSLATASVGEHAFMANLFNAVFAAYLSRVSGTEQVSIGVTFHNRSSEQDRQTVGLFMEVFPITLRVRPEDSLLALIRQVSASTAQALRHRQYSVGHSARAPAFSGLFNYMRALAKPLGNLDVRRVHPGQGSNAISLSVEPRHETFDLWFDVNADVAATSSALRLAEHLRTLLSAAILAPEASLADLSLLPPAEAKEVLAACNGPTLKQSQTKGSCLRPFENAAAATPTAIALTFGDTQLSYAQLDQRANTLAHRLKSLGAKRGKRIGICLERSPEMVIAVLAVLKSGAAYVPLDPTYPGARLRTMLGDSGPVVLITTERICASLPPFAARPLYIEQEPVATESRYEALQLSPEDIAYVIYTSGSTGTPKGVLVTHGNVSNHLAWRNSYFPVEPSDRCLQTASLSFDDSVWEILEPLSAGANLVLTRPRFEYDSAYLVQLMVDLDVTVACFVPSLLRAIIEAPQIEACSSLRRLTTGGEGLTLALQQRVRERLPKAAFFNGYGTTEATIASVYWLCEQIPGQSVVPIGRPIANTQVYVLDARGQLVPPAVLGEIYIGGLGVARGYLDRPELTAERFVHDHLSGVAGAKLYRTGDMGRLRADGVFEFAGRVDDQVKIRGIRVELGDIEAALLDHPGVRSAAVVCSDTPSGKRLTAYVVPRGGKPVAAAELRAFVRERIPPALIPNRFESIAALPLTPSGKLDRRSLPAVTADDEQSNYIAPRNELETRLVGLWESVLQARPIGIRDDFFELGGHSLSAVQVAAAIEKLLDRSLSPGLLLEAPTIELLASRLGTPSPSGAALVALMEGNSGAPLFLIHHISGDITAYRDLAHYLGAEHTIYGVRVPELDNSEKPLDRIEAMASRYVEQIRALQPKGPYLLGGHSAGAHIAFEMAQQLRAAGERIALLAILEADARRPGRRRGLIDAVRFQLESVRKLPRKQRATYLWHKLARWVESPPEQPQRPPEEGTKNAVWTAMERAVRAYDPRSYPGAITLFRATDRSVTGTYSRTLGWGRLARGGVRVIDVPGTHSTVLRPGSEPPMAAKLRDCLDEVTADQFT